MKQNPAPATAYAVHPELTAAVGVVHAAIAKAKKVAEMIDGAAAAVAQLTGDIDALRQAIASAEVDEALSDDGDPKALRKAIERQRADLSTKEAELRSAQTRITAMEQKAPGTDAEVATAGEVLQREYQGWVVATKTALAADIEEAIKPLVDVMAKARAVGWQHNMSFLDDALVPDLLNYISVNYGIARASDLSTNRLTGRTASAEAQATVAEIRNVILPVEQALAAVKSHRPYVSLANRQKTPYVLKGWGSAYHGRAGQQASEAAAQS